MPFWPRTLLKEMERAVQAKRSKSEKDKLQEDIASLKSMNMVRDRKATYGTADKSSRVEFSNIVSSNPPQTTEVRLCHQHRIYVTFHEKWTHTVIVKLILCLFVLLYN